MNAPEKIRLTEFSHGGGCGCKIAPAVLAEILATTPAAQPAEGAAGRHRDRRRCGGLPPERHAGARRHHRFLHADRRRSVRLRPHRRHQRDLRRLRDGRQADLGARAGRHAAGQAAGRGDPRDPRRRRVGVRRRPASRSRAATRSTRWSRSTAWWRSAWCIPDKVKRNSAAQGRRRADPRQAARRRHPVGGAEEGRAVGGGLRADARLDHAAQHAGRGAGGHAGRARDDRRHRLRPRRPPAGNLPRLQARRRSALR